MRRVAFASAVLTVILSSSPRPGHAQVGVNLGWDACGPARVTAKSFACDVNTGMDVLWISFSPPAGITKLVAILSRLELQSPGTLPPPWWQFDAGQCHATMGLLLVPGTPGPPSTCTSPWGVEQVGGIVFPHPANPYPNRTPVAVVTAVETANASALTPGVEYHHAGIGVRHSHTTGAGACAGCNVGICIKLESVELDQDDGPGDPDTYRIQAPQTSPYAQWQPGGDPPANCLASVPALNRTWGSIKSLYR
jgi:hypothetical protein